jgi:hypothetical protein
MPRPFKGDKDECDTFLDKVDTYFLGCQRKYRRDKDKIIFFAGILEGHAAGWFAAKKKREGESIFRSWEDFRSDFRLTFGDPDPIRSAMEFIRNLKQNGRPIYAYNIDFNKRAYDLESEYGPGALCNTYEEGLDSPVRSLLVSQCRSAKFAKNYMELQRWAGEAEIELNRLGVTQPKPVIPTLLRRFERSNNSDSQSQSRTHQQPSHSKASPSSAINSRTNNQSSSNQTRPNDTQKSRENLAPPKTDSPSESQPRGPLSQEEKNRRIQNNLCLYCSSPDHFLKDCQRKKSSDERSLTANATFGESSSRPKGNKQARRD